MSNRRSKFMCLMVNSLVVGSIGLPVSAARAAASEESVLGEVVVTAQKRAESLQSVPLAVTALSQDDLDKRGTADLASLTAKVPSMQLSTPQGVAWLFLRGAGNVNPTAGSDNGVALHFDGVYLGMASAALLDLWDVERVEVARGPQGTLFGRNATGGSVNIVSAKPTNEFDARLDIGAGNYSAFNSRIMLNQPIGPVRLRLAATVDNHGGYQTNLLTGKHNLDEKRSWLIRLSGETDITDKGNLLLTLIDAKSDGAQSSPVRPGAVYPSLYASFTQFPKPTDPRSVYKDYPESSFFITRGITGTFDYQLTGAEFKTIASYYNIQRSVYNDWDASEIPAIQFHDRDDTRQESVEVQLLSPKSSNVEWIVGANYFQMQNSRLNDIGIFPPLARAVLDGNLVSKSRAVFGQASFQIAPTIRFTAGLRYTWDSKKSDAVASLPVAIGPGQFIQVPMSGGHDYNWGAPTGRLGLDWSVTDSNMVYLSLSRGYKSGTVTTNDPALEGEIKPEHVWSVEIGSKNEFFDHRFRLNADIFAAKYQDIQQLYFLPNFVQPNAVNIGNGKVYGIETDFAAILTASFKIDGSIGYIHSSYDGFLTTDPQDLATGPQNIAGNQFSNTPTFSGTVGAEFTLPSKVGTWTLRVDDNYRSRNYFTSLQKNNQSQAAFSKIDGRIIYRSPDEKWSVEGYVLNATNKTTLQTELVVGVPLGNDVPIAWYAPPRTYGGRIGYRFK